MPDDTASIGKLYRKELGAVPGIPPQNAGLIESPNMLGGMIQNPSRDKLPVNSGRVVVNARTRDDWVGRRPGTAEFGGTKPDSNKVLASITFVSEALDVYICRITASSFYVLNAAGDGWTQYTVTDDEDNPATFPADARFSVAQYFDNLYLADGVNRIWEVNFGYKTVKQIPGSPRPHFICNFAERIIAGHIRKFAGGPRPSRIEWPVNGSVTDWTGEGSGGNDLALEDVGDSISGLVALEDLGLVVRRTSVWGITRQPFNQPIFRFSKLLTGLGCDLPYTIARIPQGAIWADQRTRDIYIFSASQGIQSILKGTNTVIFDDLSRLQFAEGRYDPFEREYHLGVAYNADDNLITRTWVISLKNGSISYDDGPEISTLGIVSVPPAGIAIDDLTGTIDAQTGTIDEYGEEGHFTPTLFKGVETGEVLKQSYDASTDWDATNFEFLFESQNLGSLTNRRSLKDLSIRALIANSGIVTLEERTEVGTWDVSKDRVIVGSSVKQNLRLPKTGLTGEDLFFQIRTTAPAAKFYSYWVRYLEKAAQR